MKVAVKANPTTLWQFLRNLPELLIHCAKWMQQLAKGLGAMVLSLAALAVVVHQLVTLLGRMFGSGN